MFRESETRGAERSGASACMMTRGKRREEVTGEAALWS